MAFFIYKLKMKVLFLASPLVFNCKPRIFPQITDNLMLSMRNENTNEVLAPIITFEVDEYLTVTIVNQPIDFAIQNKYEIVIYNDTDIIYMGKVIVLKEGTDVQNYEYKTQNNEYFRFKE